MVGKKFPLGTLIVAVVTFSTCKPVVREELPAHEQGVVASSFKKIRELFQHLLKEGEHKQARLLFQKHVRDGEFDEARRLVDERVQAGDRKGVRAFFESFVRKDTSDVDGIIAQIGGSREATEVRKLMQDLEGEIDKARDAFVHQQEAIAVVTGGGGNAEDAMRYLSQDRFKDGEWLDFDRWAEDIKYRLWGALADHAGTFEKDSIFKPYVPTEELLGAKLMEAWFKIKAKLNPELTSVPVP